MTDVQIETEIAIIDIVKTKGSLRAFLDEFATGYEPHNRSYILIAMYEGDWEELAQDFPNHIEAIQSLKSAYTTQAKGYKALYLHFWW